MGVVRNDLKTLTVDTVTGTQMNSAGGRIFLSNHADLREGEQIQSAVVALRTFGPWYQPDGGAISSTEGTSAGLQPAVGEAYEVTAISVTNGTGSPSAVTVNLFNGSALVQLVAGDAAGSGASTTFSLPYPLFLTNTLYLQLTSAATTTMNIAYHTAVRGV